MGRSSPTQSELAQVVSGTFSGVGPGSPFYVFGGMNAMLWNETNTSLTTTNASSSATVVSATGIVAGQTIDSVNVPLGTTVGSIVSTTITLAFPPGFTNANVVSGTDSAALFINGTFSATIQLERSIDGGTKYLICGIGGDGTQAIYSAGTTLSIVPYEVERGVYYRFNCTTYSSGTIKYRLAASGQLAQSYSMSL